MMVKLTSSRWGLGLILTTALAASACHRGGRPAQHPDPSGINPHAPLAMGSSATTLTSSSVVLGKVGGKRVAFVADSDTKTIRRIDLDTKSELTPLSLAFTPSQLLLLNGAIIVLSRDASTITRLRGFKGVDHPAYDSEWVAAPAEPVSMVLSPDRSTAYVTSGWGHALSEYDTFAFKQRRVINLAREPRGVALSDDGSKAFIAHAVGSHLSVVDLKAPEPTPPKLVLMRGADARATDRTEADDEDMGLDKKTRARRAAERARRAKEGLPTCQSFALAKSATVPDRLFVPEVVVDPGEASADVKSQGYGSSEGEDSEVPIVGVLDSKSGAPVPASLARTEEHTFRSMGADGDGLKSVNSCLLPRAAVIDDATKTLLVACQGIDQVVAYDATSAVPARAEVRRWDVGAGPNGIAVDPSARQAVVWSQFDRTLSIVPLDPGKDGNKDRYRPATRIATGPAAQKTMEQLGRVLFHSTHDSRISSDGRACASCHPDARDDGLVWSTPEGPRRSILLTGRLEDTAPFSWQGNSSTVQKHLKGTFDRLGGTGLEGAELDALVKYVKSVGRPQRMDPSSDDPRVARGAKIFQSSKAGCYSCHSGAAFTDGAMHNVGSGRSFNTPSLLGTGAAGPWFHDGRYASLSELLVKSDGKMGHTKHLKPEELDALETFLRSL